MPTTSNFGWTTPADTDLVKDGAAAIRTLGNGIDTSFLDLKGGTTGQVLSKASNTDLDFSWVAQDDSNAIQNAIVDAKGDLISATAADTPARLAVGANGTVLTADSTEATGLKWAAPAGAGTWSQAATGSLTGASVTVSGLSGKEYYVFFLDFSHNSGTAEYMQLQLNGDTGNNYYDFGNASAISALLPCGNTTVAGNTERNGGFYIGMADTAMVYKPVLSMPPVDGTIGGQNGGWYGSSSAITSMKFFMSGGSFDAGTYYVWSRG